MLPRIAYGLRASLAGSVHCIRANFEDAEVQDPRIVWRRLAAAVHVEEELVRLRGLDRHGYPYYASTSHLRGANLPSRPIEHFQEERPSAYSRPRFNHQRERDVFGLYRRDPNLRVIFHPAKGFVAERLEHAPPCAQLEPGAPDDIGGNGGGRRFAGLKANKLKPCAYLPAVAAG